MSIRADPPDCVFEVDYLSSGRPGAMLYVRDPSDGEALREVVDDFYIQAGAELPAGAVRRGAGRSSCLDAKETS